MRGALTKIGDTFDRMTGRRWIPSSSLATSGLIERLKLLMDGEARLIPGKGTVVPHNIKLKMQWDKFSTDADDAMVKLETELLTAAADHINIDIIYLPDPSDFHRNDLGRGRRKRVLADADLVHE